VSTLLLTYIFHDKGRGTLVRCPLGFSFFFVFLFFVGTCFSVSSDDKLVLFLFPGIPTDDPAIVAFYDKRIYKKLRLKELSFLFFVYKLFSFWIWLKYCLLDLKQSINQFAHIIVSSSIDVSTLLFNINIPWWQGHTRTQKNTYMNNTDSIKTWIQSWWTGSVSIPYIF
jgi:hypothetical protein